MESHAFLPSPLVFEARLSDWLGAEIHVKHDELFSFPGGGNKARKAQFIFREAEKKGFNAVVTTGSAQSNHIRACAIMAARHGWRSRIVIHDPPPAQLRGNLLLTAMSGAKISFCEILDVAHAMDEAMSELRAEGSNPLYIWGGGHCLEGSYAYFHSVTEMKAQWNAPNAVPDYVVLASGTGTTQAGIHAGLARWDNRIRCIGFSVARKKNRGTEEIEKSLAELNAFLADGAQCAPVHFDDRFHFGGYARADESLRAFVREAAARTGVIVDPVYSGKALFGLKQYIQSGEIPHGGRVVFWHTGGLLNLTE